MKKAIKQKWVKALRSGRYRQGEAELKANDGTYCCLGVLCNVLGAKWSETRAGDRIATIDGKKLNVIGEELLRPGILRQVGLTKAQQTHLVHMNDGKMDTHPAIPAQRFKQIADYIEQNL